MPAIAVLAIGDELLNGSLSDTNSATIARLLARDGFTLRQVRIVGDRIDAIVPALRELSASHDALITTGGLGPTDDDLTAEALAAAGNTVTALNDEAQRLVDSYFARLGRPKHQRNLKSATLPLGAIPFENPRGTAPGIRMTLGSCQAFSLPGVPDEMAAMVESAVVPALVELFGRPLHQPERVLTLFGIPEPQVEEKLHTVGLPEGVQLAFGVEFPLVLVKLRATGKKAKELLDAAERVVDATFAGQIVARGSETLAGATATLLIETGKTLALAESCTGGLIGKMLTDIPGSSAFFDRGAITYSNRAKQEWLGVTEQVLEQGGAVSGACAKAMAEGIRQVADSDFGLAVTGIAGPDGGSDDKPVGTVFIALANATDTVVEHHRFAGDRGRVRVRTACAALALLQRHLRET